MVYRMLQNNIEVHGAIWEGDFSKKDFSSKRNYFAVLNCSIGDEIKLQFTGDDTDISLSPRDSTGYGDHHSHSAAIIIKQIELRTEAEAVTPANFTFKHFECDVSTTGRAFALVLIIFIVVLIWMFSLWTKIPILNILVGLVVCYFAWVVAKCFFLANVLFIIMGLTSILYGLLYGSKKK